MIIFKVLLVVFLVLLLLGIIVFWLSSLHKNEHDDAYDRQDKGTKGD